MWFFLALLVAIITSLVVVIAKRVMRELNEYHYLFISGLFIILFLFLIIINFYQIPKFDDKFVLLILTNVVLGSIAAIFAYKAIRISEISLVTPMSAFNPVFTAVIAFIFLDENIIFKGWLGILLICIGAYILQISSLKTGWLAPFKDLLTHKGVLLSLIAYFIWAITPLLEKTAIFHTNPQTPPFVAMMGQIGTTAVFGLISSKSLNKKSIKVMKSSIPLLLLIGVLWAIASSAAMITFSLTNLGYATAIFKLSMIFTVVLGWVFFKERNIKDRLLGSIVMLVGVILLVI